MTAIQVGIARKIISPPLGIYLMGYGNRIQGNTGIFDDLYVTTLALKTGDTRAALLTVDHTFINTVIVDRIKTRIFETCGIQPNSVFVCCSHTHGGPVGYADENSRQEDRDYIEFLVETLAASVVEAATALQPAHLVGGTSEAFININRRARAEDGSIIIGRPYQHFVHRDTHCCGVPDGGERESSPDFLHNLDSWFYKYKFLFYVCNRHHQSNCRRVRQTGGL